jgi:hypothetical protein
MAGPRTGAGAGRGAAGEAVPHPASCPAEPDSVARLLLLLAGFGGPVSGGRCGRRCGCSAGGCCEDPCERVRVGWLGRAGVWASRRGSRACSRRGSSRPRRSPGLAAPCGATFASAASRPTATSTPRALPRGNRGVARPAVGAADPRDAFGLPGWVACAIELGGPFGSDDERQWQDGLARVVQRGRLPVRPHVPGLQRGGGPKWSSCSAGSGSACVDLPVRAFLGRCIGLARRSS